MGADELLSAVVQKTISSDFSQLSLMTVRDFEGYLEDRDIDIDQEDLEYYEKTGLLLPIARLHRPLAPKGSRRKYDGISLATWAIGRYLQDGLLKFPTIGDFRPWAENKDGYEERVVPLYHRYQIPQLLQFYNSTRLLLSGEALDGEIDAKKMTGFRDAVISVTIKNRVKATKMLALLVELETAYLPIYNDNFRQNIMASDSLAQWKSWRDKAFSPKSLLQDLDLSLEEVRSYRDTLAVRGISMDPLASWFVLVQLSNAQARRRLKGKALLAQDHYEMAGTLEEFDLFQIRVQLQRPSGRVLRFLLGASQAIVDVVETGKVSEFGRFKDDVSHPVDSLDDCIG